MKWTFAVSALSSPVIKYIVSLRKRFIYSGWKAGKGYAKQAQNNSGRNAGVFLIMQDIRRD